MSDKSFRLHFGIFQDIILIKIYLLLAAFIAIYLYDTQRIHSIELYRLLMDISTNAAWFVLIIVYLIAQVIYDILHNYIQNKKNKRGKK